ncbi:PAS domain S-box protein, partial [Patescibacteria group bacterium]|nr:PAS domain S-box protein [Patescibacteria group bacterium]
YRMVGIMADISQTKTYEKKIETLSLIQKKIIDKAPIGIYTANSQGIVTYTNPTFAKISGDNTKELMGLNVFDLPTYKQAGITTKIQQVFKGQDFSISDVEYTSFYSHKKTYRNFYGLPLKNEKGQIESALVFVEDITHYKEIENELQNKIDQLEIFNKATVGRELKMIKLKEKISELEEEIESLKK